MRQKGIRLSTRFAAVGVLILILCKKNNGMIYKGKFFFEKFIKSSFFTRIKNSNSFCCY